MSAPPPPFPPPQGPAPKDPSYEHHAAACPAQTNIGPPPPVYMVAPPPNQTPSYGFDNGQPPPYIQPKEADETAVKKRRICGMTTSSFVGIIVTLVAAGVIAGGVYGYQQKIKPKL